MTPFPTASASLCSDYPPPRPLPRPLRSEEVDGLLFSLRQSCQKADMRMSFISV